MRCTDCFELLNAYADGELTAEQRGEVDAHVAGCAECARQLATLTTLSQSLREGLVRYTAPDLLEARIRASLESPAVQGTPSRWRVAARLAAAGLLVAIASSALTTVVLRRGGDNSALEQSVLTSHIRSLMPGHLTDVASNNQHNVKPWFNGRVDLSPTVPLLDSVGFPLVGGRLDYLAGHAAAVVVYGRRQHLINVYSWPTSRDDAAPATITDHGYHLVHWRDGGVELWAVSDLGLPELDAFVATFRRAR